jgi:hypothetical protein
MERISCLSKGGKTNTVKTARIKTGAAKFQNRRERKTAKAGYKIEHDKKNQASGKTQVTPKKKYNKA